MEILSNIYVKVNNIEDYEKAILVLQIYCINKDSFLDSFNILLWLNKKMYVYIYLDNNSKLYRTPIINFKTLGTYTQISLTDLLNNY